MSKAIAILFVSLTLGLGWAIRGHFGHEWGAAWAGVMAGLAVVAVSRRPDWTVRAPVVGALAGVGWAVGGMMSYGRVVGFCRGSYFLDVYYGLLMLAVIGGLYGLIGGGFLGLGLETTERRKPDWAALITQMVAAAMLAWGLLIYQLEWLMTPPRSELWAACLGAGIALVWYCHRAGFHLALRTALYSALGAGFGFAFGNFLQTMGSLSGIAINWWNVMEFTLGAFGGLGMAYAVFTRSWPACSKPNTTANGLALLFVLLAIPATNIQQAFDPEKLIEMATRAGLAEPTAFAVQHIRGACAATIVALAIGCALWRRSNRKQNTAAPSRSLALLVLVSLLYIVFSHLRKGALVIGFESQPEQVAYWIVFAATGLVYAASRVCECQPAVLQESTGVDTPLPRVLESGRHFLILSLVLILACGLLAWISINAHEGLPGAHSRFWPSG
jgi:hypothetical protein